MGDIVLMCSRWDRLDSGYLLCWHVVAVAMDHHWSNLNLNQAYGRLPTPANAAAAAGLNRFDLHLLEQQGFATAGWFQLTLTSEIITTLPSAALFSCLAC